MLLPGGGLVEGARTAWKENSLKGTSSPAPGVSMPQQEKIDLIEDKNYVLLMYVSQGPNKCLLNDRFHLILPPQTKRSFF